MQVGNDRFLQGRDDVGDIRITRLVEGGRDTDANDIALGDR